jgi:antitoxin VapB
MPLYIKDNETAVLVARLAQLQGLSKQGAVRMAIQAALDKAAECIPVEARLRSGLRTPCLPPRENARTRRSSTACQVSFDAFRGCIGANIDSDPKERRSLSPATSNKTGTGLYSANRRGIACGCF